MCNWCVFSYWDCSTLNIYYFLQISSHVKAINAIYQSTDFGGIRDISFIVKRVRVSFILRMRCAKGECQLIQWNQHRLWHLQFICPTFPPSVVNFFVFQINGTKEANDESNPFRFSSIGVERFLQLNSEQNHDAFCLAYLFTDRDFDDGVLGLAWVGSSGGLC